MVVPLLLLPTAAACNTDVRSPLMTSPPPLKAGQAFRDICTGCDMFIANSPAVDELIAGAARGFDGAGGSVTFCPQYDRTIRLACSPLLG